MNRNGGWQGWAALVLAGLALVITLVGRQSGPSVIIMGSGAATVAPGGLPAAGWGAPQDEQGREWNGPAFNQERGGPGYGRRGGHHGPFGFLGGIVRFLGFLLLIGFVLRFFGMRRWWGRGHGGPPWARGHGEHGGHCGPQQPQPEGQQPQQQPTSDRDRPSTGETTRL